MSDLHVLVLELEKIKKEANGHKAKVAELSNQNTKLKVGAVKMEKLLDAKAKELQQVEARWKRRCESLERDASNLQNKLQDAKSRSAQLQGQISNRAKPSGGDAGSGPAHARTPAAAVAGPTTASGRHATNLLGFNKTSHGIF